MNTSHCCPPKQHVCPNCGHCPCCGRSNYYSTPYWQVYPVPKIWCGTTAGDSTHSSYTVQMTLNQGQSSYTVN